MKAIKINKETSPILYKILRTIVYSIIGKISECEISQNTETRVSNFSLLGIKGILYEEECYRLNSVYYLESFYILLRRERIPIIEFLN
jgi:hypothetical protein